MSKLVKLDVTDKDAVYVDNTRITDRSTKWGLHRIIFTVQTPQSEVVKTLLANGYERQAKRIDTEPYLSEVPK
jgi:hypothetical protein